MTDLEQTMKHAQEEIRRLRTANADMAGKLEIVELFQRLIMPQGPNGMAVDVVWLLQQQIDQVHEASKAKEAAANGN